MHGFLRLALSDSLSFNPSSKLGGSIDNFRESAFLKSKINSGLKKYYKDVLDVHSFGNHVTAMLSVADILQIGGASAVQFAGGPYIDVKVGRMDNKNTTSKTTALPDPDWDVSDIDSKLGQELGLSNKEIVALFGHRTLGFFSNKSEDKEVRWSMNPYVFDNNYFIELTTHDSPYLRTPSDKALINESKYLEHVELFAKDEQAFFEEFASAYQKVGEYGNSNLLSEKDQLQESKI
eukprot:CAMPEP_0170514024 /NCGR_PEP_ID=MMETSP0209-20121228/584_1 /TAXON_ID=665100 ORGANISM="Litonotus pictus, Strain P1" /NCGR_SAMPLE_ID=MMETSP0209 /ASSEMBLY_ACC=CAM_ASM_000301 /LENGTH=234 /DNA_ID=CAMNT_0010797923 /DNA_START=62 /DNA_END=766 /DNA_ORIENTATION=-